MPDDDERLTRLEEAIFGNGTSGGVLTKIVRIENELEHMNRTLSAINANLSKLVWIIIAAFLMAILGMVLRPQTVGGSPNNSTSVQVGQSDKEMAKSGKTFLTVADVALRESVSERTIVAWIAEGRVHPQPVKDGKSYTISANYSISPPSSEYSGTEAALSANEPNKPNPTQTHEPK